MGGSFIFLSLIFLVVGLIVGGLLKRRMAEYSQIPIESGLSGKEVAEKMLRDNGILDVTVTSVDGFLTDHYNPANKTVNLSTDVYNGRSVASAAIAAHECGHAVQHAHAYIWLGLRSALVPAVSFSSKYVQWILFAGVMMLRSFPQLLEAGVILFAVTTLFSIITLPVEFDASRRALIWLDSTNIMGSEAHDKARNGLKWAASTYVIAALASIATLLNYLSFLNRRN
ncbi:MAG: zinc metallopeptidase [Sphingobacteriales bacterium]|nr:MAG: zinc metallopeptidase [Sphingobacteriales bacterium]